MFTIMCYPLIGLYLFYEVTNLNDRATIWMFVLHLIVANL